MGNNSASNTTWGFNALRHSHIEERREQGGPTPTLCGAGCLSCARVACAPVCRARRSTAWMPLHACVFPFQGISTPMVRTCKQGEALSSRRCSGRDLSLSRGFHCCCAPLARGGTALALDKVIVCASCHHCAVCAPLPNRSAQGQCKTTRCREAPTRARVFESISSFVRATAATRAQACVPA